MQKANFGDEGFPWRGFIVLPPGFNLPGSLELVDFLICNDLDPITCVLPNQDSMGVRVVLNDLEHGG